MHVRPLLKIISQSALMLMVAASAQAQAPGQRALVQETPETGPIRLGDPISSDTREFLQLTQNANLEPMPNFTFACREFTGGPTLENHWYRRFYLNEYSEIENDLYIFSVDVAFEQIKLHDIMGDEIPVTINLYTLPRSTPAGTIPSLSSEQMTLIGTQGIRPPDGSMITVNIPVFGHISDAHTKDLVLHVSADHLDFGLGTIVIGGNNAGQTHASFWSSPDPFCFGSGAYSNPTDLGPILSPNIHLIMAVNARTQLDEEPVTISADGGAGWRMLSAPLLNSTVQTLADANVVHGIPGEYPDTPNANLFIGYDGFNDLESYERGFVLPSGLSHPLVPGHGFIWYLYDTQYETGYTPPKSAGDGSSVHRRLPVDIEYAGFPVVFEMHQVTFTEADRVAGNDDGWYLIGNPYTEAYGVRGIVPNSGAYSSFYYHWDAEAGEYVLLNGSGITLPVPMPTHAPVGAGFFMQFGHLPTLPVTITFGPPLSGPPGGPGRLSDETFTAHFELTGELLVEYDGNQIPIEVSDRNTRVVFSEDATDGFDFLDAGKLTPLSYYWANIALMGIHGDEIVRRSVESRPLPLEAVTIPMALSTYANGLDAGGSFTISLTNNFLGEGWQVTLIDLETGETVNLLTDSHTFTIEAQSAIDADQRFEITFTPPNVSGDGSSESYVFGLEAVWPNPTTSTAQVAFTLEIPDEITIEVFDVLGRRVLQIANVEYVAGRHVMPLYTGMMASGVYVVRLTAGSQVAVQRVTVAK